MKAVSWQHWHRVRRLPRDIRMGALAYRLKRPFLWLPRLGERLFSANAMALDAIPADTWPGNAEEGSAIVQGSIYLAGKRLEDPEPFWNPPGASPDFVGELHSFCWLQDLRALGGDPARRRARELALDWIDSQSRPSGPGWEPEILGRRLTAWLGHYEFFVASAETGVRRRIIASVERQAAQLAAILPAGLSGSRLIAALKGLILAGTALPGAAAWRRRGLQMLERELRRQILPDGGHIERAPAAQLAVLKDLLDLRAALVAGDGEVPRAIEAAIAAMAPVLRLYRHGDDRLALFHGGDEGDNLQIDLALQRCPGRKRPLLSAPDSGFQRLQAGRAVVIMDCGDPPPPGFDLSAHAAPLAFEFSLGRERVIVNCGAQPANPDWRLAQRATAAHTTLVLEDSNSLVVLPAGGLEASAGEEPVSVTCRRTEEEGAQLLECSHDGYLVRLGAYHHRNLYLSAAGDDLRGEDRIILRRPTALGFSLRFHLHPGIRALASQDSRSIFLNPRKGGGWRFICQGAEIALEPSIYLGNPGAVRRTQQIVLTGRTMEAKTVIKWALKKEG